LDGDDWFSDEYTFSDGTFYSERVLLEPPYYRGDDYNVMVTCGSDVVTRAFAVVQPVSLVQPLQRGWEYFFDPSNLEAMMIFVGLIGVVVIMVLY